MRVIDEKGEQLGIMDPRDAVRMAAERELDLVEVSPQTRPPVCRLMDYGRWKYETAKKGREATKVKKHSQQLREVKLRPKIDDHDYQVKSRMVKRLLQEGDKVKVTMMFRGREVVHAHIALKLLEQVFNDSADLAIIENKPRLEGRNMIMVLAPKAGTAAGDQKVGFGAPAPGAPPSPAPAPAPPPPPAPTKS